MTNVIISTAKKILADPVSLVRSGSAQIHAADAQTKQARDREIAGKQHLITALAPAADVEANLPPELAARGESRAAEHGRAIIESVGGRAEADMSGTITGVYRPRSLADAIGPLTLDALCALVPDLVLAGLRRVIAQTPYDAGPAMSERVKLAAAADVRIRELEAEHEAIVTAAREEAGITIPELDANCIRRLRAAQAREEVERFNEANRKAIERGAVRAREYEQL